MSSVLGQRTREFVMKSQDIVILLKLASLEAQIRQGCLDASVTSHPFALRSLEAALGISKTETGASIQPSVAATLAIKSGVRPKVIRRNLTEL